MQVGLDLCGAHLLDDPCGHAHGHRAVRDDHALRHQRTRADDAVFAHDTVVEQGGVHSDEAAIPYRAPVHQRAVAHSDVPAQRHGPAHIAVQHGVVLHVGVLADDKLAVVAAQHCTVPHRGTGFEDHIALHGGVGRNERSPLIAGNFSTKGQKHC